MNLSSSFKRRESTQEVDLSAPPPLKNVLPHTQPEVFERGGVGDCLQGCGVAFSTV